MICMDWFLKFKKDFSSGENIEFGERSPRMGQLPKANENRAGVFG